MNWVHKFIKLAKEDKKLFFEALFFLWFSKILLLLMPFKTCIKFLKPAEKMNTQPTPEFLRNVRNAVSRANKTALWKNICLVKSFAARFMLQRRGIPSVMYLGLQIDKESEKKLNAHAWLISEDITITPKGPAFKEIYSV